MPEPQKAYCPECGKLFLADTGVRSSDPDLSALVFCSEGCAVRSRKYPDRGLSARG